MITSLDFVAVPSQDVERSRTAVHEIAGQPQPIASGVEGQPAQQPAQGAVAPLDVPDRVGCARVAFPHDRIFTRPGPAVEERPGPSR